MVLAYMIFGAFLLIVLNIVSNKHHNNTKKIKDHIKNGDIVPSDMSEPLK